MQQVLPTVQRIAISSLPGRRCAADGLVPPELRLQRAFAASQRRQLVLQLV
jgi:hypothetical protein